MKTSKIPPTPSFSRAVMPYLFLMEACRLEAWGREFHSPQYRISMSIRPPPWEDIGAAIVYDASMTPGDSMLALLDTDPGIDDALALLYAWGSPGLRLAGITTLAGHADVQEAEREPI